MTHRPRRGYADGPYGQVHFLDTREGAPAVLIHQAPMNAHQFDAVMGLLSARGLRAIAIDLPGFGQSDPPDNAPTILDYARAVPAVLDHLGIAAADLIGHHTGAMVATEAALAFPDRVRRLILNGPVPLEDAERAAFLHDVEVREKGFAITPDGAHLAEAFRRRLDYCGGTIPPARVQDYILWMVGSPGPFWYGHHAAFTYDHAARLPLVEAPTMILTNTGDAIFDHACRTRAMRPDWAFTAIEGGGIDIQDQAPAAWAAAVADFLTGSG